MKRRLVVDLAAARAVWRIPPGAVNQIRGALPEWDVIQVEAPANSDGDGGGGSAAAIAAAEGAEVYLGYGVPNGVVEASRGSLKWVHTATAGVAPTLAALKGSGVTVTNSAGIHAEPMADWVLAATLYFARGFDHAVRAQAQSQWAKDAFTDGSHPFPELSDLRLGILGLGGIGTAVAKRGLALGMKVAGVRRRPAQGAQKGMQWVGGFDALDTLASESDVLAITVPKTPETTGVVSDRVLGKLPRGAVLVNASRGGILDEDALLRALDGGTLRGAALDVFGTEPLPATHPLWRHPRVLITPHVSAVTARFWDREMALILNNVRRYLGGQSLVNVVDLEAGY
ncbi:MAG TPA: D-2-hydroxyacid dehydrogenase [Gemmatimonadales bacterium]|nr:D-2-hydroxyacid dehydrogenase [Gemmatimonadales bacterium]